MASGTLGSPSGNVIVPVANLQKRSKVVDNAVLALTAVTNLSALSNVAAYGYCYADSTGKWFLYAEGQFTSTLSTGTASVFSIAGVVFKNDTTGGSQHQLCNIDISSTATIYNICVVNTGNIEIGHANINAARTIRFQLDSRLESEPTWYAANAEGAPSVAAYIPSASATPGLLPYYSAWATFVPNLVKSGGSGSISGTPTVTHARWSRIANTATVSFYIGAFTVASNTITVGITLPVASTNVIRIPVYGYNNSTYVTGVLAVAAGSTTANVEGISFAAVSGNELGGTFSYEVT